MRRQQIDLGGTVDASAIYLHGVTVGGATHDVFFVTTSYGKTLAIDAEGGAVLWTHTPSGYSGWAGSRQVTTATPVADPDRSAIYAANPGGEIEKLAVADGHALWSVAVTRLPEREKLGSALNYFRGRVIVTTDGYIGDAAPYQGHVAIIDGASGRLLHIWNSLCSDRTGLLEPASCSQSGSAIWGRAGAVIDTATGHIFVATGNGRWDGRTNWGDAIIELDADATTILGNFTPTNTGDLESFDGDLGSSSPVLAGGAYVVQGGKEGIIRVIDWSRMTGSAPHKGGEISSVKSGSGKGLFTAPALWRNGATTWLFVGDFGALAAFTFADGKLQLRWKNDHPTSSPVVAGGLLYGYDVDGELRVYEPETGRELAALDCGDGHWNSPIIADGRIALPEGSSNKHRESGVLNIWRVPRG